MTKLGQEIGKLTYKLWVMRDEMKHDIDDGIKDDIVVN